MKTTPIHLTEEEAKFLLRCIKSHRLYVERMMMDGELIDGSLIENLSIEFGFSNRLRRWLSEIIHEP